jgi:hypothetical protein
MTSYTSEFVVGSAFVAALGVTAYVVAQLRPNDAVIPTVVEPFKSQVLSLLLCRAFLILLSKLEALALLHAKAWGKQWPQSEGTIDKTEISDESDSVDDEIYNLTDKLHIPPTFTYRYFEEILDLRTALGANIGEKVTDAVLVIREEYEILRKVLEKDREHRSVAVTGHPGIGSYESLFRVEC